MQVQTQTQRIESQSNPMLRLAMYWDSNPIQCTSWPCIKIPIQSNAQAGRTLILLSRKCIRLKYRISEKHRKGLMKAMGTCERPHTTWEQQHCSWWHYFINKHVDGIERRVTDDPPQGTIKKQQEIQCVWNTSLSPAGLKGLQTPLNA